MNQMRITAFLVRYGVIIMVFLSAVGSVYALGLEKVGVIAPAAPDGLMSPTAFCYDNLKGYFLVANTTLRQVIVVSRDNRVVKVFGKKSEFGFPIAMGINSQGALFIAEKNSESIRVVPRYDSVVTEDFSFMDLSPFRRSAPVQPIALFFDETDNLLVADRGNRQVIVLDREGKLKFTIPDVGEPAAIRMDHAGKMLIADTALGGIRVYNPDGSLLRTLGARFSQVQVKDPLRVKGLAVDQAGRIWAVDAIGQGIKALDSMGNVVFSAARPDLFSPTDLAIDAEGNLYVLEQGGNRITVFRISGF